MLPTKLAFASMIALLAIPQQGLEPQEPNHPDLAKLSWLAGTWELKDGERTTEEHWLPLAGSTIMGLSHTYDATRTHSFEFLRITLQHGRIAYVAQPGGGQPVPFLAVEIDDTQAVFENPKHDHPQRIRYERTEAGVTATISLLDGSKAASFAFRRRGE
jgi:hypothetical protein